MAVEGLFSFIPIKEILFTSISLIVLYNPFSKPLQLISVTDRVKDEVRKDIAIRASIFAFVLGVAAVFFGYIFLQAIDVSLSSFKIFGGVVLLFFGIQSGLGYSLGKENEKGADVALVPLATPLLTGPGAISALMLFTIEYGQIITIVALAICLFICFIFMWFSKIICDLLNEEAVKVVSRLMGMILVAFAVQFVVSGLRVA